MTAEESTLTVEGKLLEFINSTLRPASDPVPDASASLLKARMLDSMAILELIVFMEEAFGIQIDGSTLERGQFETVNSIAGVVRAAGGGDGAA